MNNVNKSFRYPCANSFWSSLSISKQMGTWRTALEKNRYVLEAADFLSLRGGMVQLENFNAFFEQSLESQCPCIVTGAQDDQLLQTVANTFSQNLVDEPEPGQHGAAHPRNDVFPVADQLFAFCFVMIKRL